MERHVFKYKALVRDVLSAAPFGEGGDVKARGVWVDVLGLSPNHFTKGRKKCFTAALREEAASRTSLLRCIGDASSGFYFYLEQASADGGRIPEEPRKADALVSEPRKGPPRAAKRRREAEATSEHVSGEKEHKVSAMAPPELAPVDWTAEVAVSGLPRLRELLQAATAEQRAAARDARRTAADACSASAAAQLAALDAADAREVAASTRLRQLLTAAERVMARVARRHAAEKALREANEAAAEAASLQAQAEALAAELAELD